MDVAALPRGAPDLGAVVRSFDEARQALEGEEHLALDLETGGFSPWKAPIHVVTLYGPASGTIAVLHYPRGTPVDRGLMAWLGAVPEITTHNGVGFDILFLARNGMDWRAPRFYDTMVGEQAVLATGRRDVRVNLADTAKRRLGKVLDKAIDHGSWGNPELDEVQLAYCAGDIRHLIDLRRSQEERAAQTPHGVRCLEFEQGLIPAVVEMELRGLPVDLDLLAEYLRLQARRAAELDPLLRRALAVEETDFGGSLNSPVQMKRRLGAVFGDRLFPDTKAERLMEYQVFGDELGEACRLYLEYKRAKKRGEMFGEKWETQLVDHGSHTRVHGRFWQLGTSTGRFSASSPNLQQMPRDIRGVFAEREGHAVGKTDYAAIEVRVAAALAGDDDMIRAFNDGQDIHRVVAAAGFGVPPEEVTPEVRKIAKAMSFTLLFGGGVETFRAYAANNGSRISHAEAESAVERFFDQFHGIARMRQVAIDRCRTGRAVPITYPTGLRRILVGADLRPTTLLNNLVQGTAASGIKYALEELLRSGFIRYVCAVVHDEVVYTAPWGEIEEVRSAVEDAMLAGMERALEGCPPVMIEVESSHGQSWAGDPASERVARRMPGA